jgi:hypothetical protein
MTGKATMEPIVEWRMKKWIEERKKDRENSGKGHVDRWMMDSEEAASFVTGCSHPSTELAPHVAPATDQALIGRDFCSPGVRNSQHLAPMSSHDTTSQPEPPTPPLGSRHTAARQVEEEQV